MRWSSMKSCILALILALVCNGVLAGGAVGLESREDSEGRDIVDFPDCVYCGMHRQTYAHSRMLVVYADGAVFGVCSLYCAALNLVIQIDRPLKAVWVADYRSKKLIRAEDAWWVIGGAKPGVMTSRAKWAFKDKADAYTFISENGGVIGSFDEAMRATFEDMYRDTRMIRTKKQIGKMAPE